MTIQWGGVAGHLRVGIEWSTDAYDTNTASINIYGDYYVETQAWGFSQSMSVTIGGDRSGSIGFTASSGPGQTVLIYVGRVTIASQVQSYGGGPTYTLTGVTVGNTQGADPSVSTNFSLPARPPNRPGIPPITADSVTSNSARIVVSAAAGNGSQLDSYQVLVGTLGNNAGEVISSQVWNSTGSGTVTVTGLTRAFPYAYIVRAHAADTGYGDWAGPQYFTTLSTVPDQPSPPSPSSVQSVSAVISWSAPANGGSAITSYTLQYSTSPSFVGAVTVSGATSGMTVSGLLARTTYYFRVRATNANGPGAFSDGTQLTTLSGLVVNVSGTWFPTSGLWVNVSGNWFPISVLYKNVSGNWFI